jgi:hypothetical protein
VINRRNDRWQPEYRRVLFLVLCVVAMVLLAGVLVDRGPVVPQVIGSGVLVFALFTAALVSARQLTDSAFPLLFGGGAAFFAAVAATSAVDGDPEGVAWTPPAMLAASVAIVVIIALLLLAQRTITPVMPFAPLLVIGVTALMVVFVLLLQESSQMNASGASAAASSVVFMLILIAPRAAVKFSRLRGPQLPKTGADMSFDIEPENSDLVKSRANDADTYLTVAMVSSALILPVLFHHGDPGLVGLDVGAGDLQRNPVALTYLLRTLAADRPRGGRYCRLPHGGHEILRHALVRRAFRAARRARRGARSAGDGRAPALAAPDAAVLGICGHLHGRDHLGSRAAGARPGAGAVHVGTRIVRVGIRADSA